MNHIVPNRRFIFCFQQIARTAKKTDGFHNWLFCISFGPDQTVGRGLRSALGSQYFYFSSFICSHMFKQSLRSQDLFFIFCLFPWNELLTSVIFTFTHDLSILSRFSPERSKSSNLFLASCWKWFPIERFFNFSSLNYRNFWH